MSKIITLANHKGGVRKTTLTLSLADALAREDLSVLVIDMDPQANATRLIYSFDEAPSATIEKVLDGVASVAEAIIQQTRVEGVHLIGSTIKLGNLEREMQQRPFFSTTSLLQERLKVVEDIYDVILIDTPPALNFLTANALIAADWVFVPVESGSKLSLLGTDDMLKFIADARKANPRLGFGGAILTQHDARKTMCKIAAGSVKGYYEKVLDATFPPTTDVHKAQAGGQTILQYDRDHTASRNVVAMAREIAGIVGLPVKAKIEDKNDE
jgi:chromosome partitioning protein